jgi:hypothetical protein
MAPIRRSYLPVFTSLMILVMLAILTEQHGTKREGLTLLLRFSARMSFLLFVLWLSLPAVARLSARLPGLLAAEPHLLISFALAHTIHVAVIFYAASQGFFAQITERELLVTGGGGGGAYLMIVLMGLTALRSASRARAILRGVGTIYVWLVFLNSYVSRLREGDSFGGAGIAALFIAAALALAAWRVRRQAPNARTASA